MAYALVHILGSRSGYTTLDATPALTAGERSELEVLSFGDATNEAAMRQLDSSAAMIGRRLKSGRFAISRMLPGGKDDAGRPTIEVISLVLEPDAYTAIAGALSDLASDARIWRDAQDAVARGYELKGRSPTSVATDRRVLRAFDTWIAARKHGGIGLLDTSDAAGILGMISLLNPSDRLELRWGVGVLSISAPVDVCTFAPSTSMTGARQVVRASTTGTWLSPEMEHAEWLLKNNDATLPLIASLVSTMITERAIGEGSAAQKTGQNAFTPRRVKPQRSNLTKIAACCAALSLLLLCAVAAVSGWRFASKKAAVEAARLVAVEVEAANARAAEAARRVAAEAEAARRAAAEAEAARRVAAEAEAAGRVAAEAEAARRVAAEAAADKAEAARLAAVEAKAAAAAAAAASASASASAPPPQDASPIDECYANYEIDLASLKSCRIAIRAVVVPKLEKNSPSGKSTDAEKQIYWRDIQSEVEVAVGELETVVWEVIVLDHVRKTSASSYKDSVTEDNQELLPTVISMNGFCPVLSKDLNKFQGRKYAASAGLCPALCSEWLSILQCLRIKMEELNEIVTKMNADRKHMYSNIPESTQGQDAKKPFDSYKTKPFEFLVDSKLKPPEEGKMYLVPDCEADVRLLIRTTKDWDTMIDKEIKELVKFGLPKSDSAEECN